VSVFGCWLSGVGCQGLIIRYGLSGVGCRVLFVGYWLSTVGCRVLGDDCLCQSSLSFSVVSA